MPLTLPYKLVIWMIPFSITWDFFSIYYQEGDKTLAILRGVILVIFILMVSGKIERSRITTSVFLFIAYITCLFPSASNLFYSLNVSVKIFITLMMLPVGFSLVKTKATMDLLNDKILAIYLIIIIGFALYNIFGVGGYSYVDVGFDTGPLRDSWNTLTYALLLAPLYLNMTNNAMKRAIFVACFIVILVILFVSFKRIAMAGFLFGYLVFIYKYGEYRKSIKYIMLVCAFLVALYPIYYDAVLMKYEVRQERFNIANLIEAEARSRETPLIWGEIFSFKNPTKSFFGGEAFNSVGMYADGAFGKRQAHVDYNLILISNGIFGLLLYLNIYYQIYRTWRTCHSLSKHHAYRIYEAILITLVLTSLLTSFGGQMYGFAFRCIIFLYIGAILGLLTNHRNTVESVD